MTPNQSIIGSGQLRLSCDICGRTDLSAQLPIDASGGGQRWVTICQWCLVRALDVAADIHFERNLQVIQIGRDARSHLKETGRIHDKRKPTRR